MKRGCLVIDYIMSILDIPAYYYLISAGVGLAVGLIRKDWAAGLLTACMFFIFAGTVLIRNVGKIRYELVPFWSWQHENLRDQIFANIWMFIPVGFLLGLKIGWKSIPTAAAYSLLIEIIQLVTCTGLFEFDDVIHNTLGAVIGFGLLILWRRVKKRF